MADSRLLYANVGVLSATWSQTTGGTATGYPLTNLNNFKRGLPWRSSTTNGNQVIVATFPVSVIKAVVIINYLAHSGGGTIKAEYKNGGGAYANFGGGTGLFTLPASNRTRLTALYETGGVTATDIRITYTNTGAVTTFVELGLAYIGGYSQPTQNVSPGVTQAMVDPSSVTYSENGQKYVWTRQKFLQFGVTYRPLGDTDKDTVQSVFDSIGTGTPFIFAIDPTDVDLTAYGYLAEQMSVNHIANSGVTPYWQADITFEEAR